MASQVTLASIPSKAVHMLLQHGSNSKEGEEAALALIRKYHSDLPTLLEMDQFEEARAEKHVGVIGTVLSWTDLDKNTSTPTDGINGEKTKIDILSQVKANPLINFSVFSTEEQAVYTESLDGLNSSTANELAARTDEGEQFVPTDSPRMIEYKVSEKNSMMWKIPNMNNLAPLTLEMWQKLIHASDAELKTCMSNALNGITPAKLMASKDTIKMSFFRDKYLVHCGEPITVRLKGSMPTDSSRLPKHKSTLWNWLRPYIRCNCKSDGKHDNSRTRCKGEMIWMDHAIWYMYNNLGDFFNQSTVQGKYMAFLIFLGGEARSAILAHMAFLHT
ncbi:hypothetical protein R1sor_015096 [Riccia sorocarpa]|uniref:Uncharacterized protein n=1 Tax=Riccia sorocarpa TaxID=122646 RepID=A0ABD3HB96_9MARC